MLWEFRRLLLPAGRDRNVIKKKKTPLLNCSKPKNIYLSGHLGTNKLYVPIQSEDTWVQSGTAS